MGVVDFRVLVPESEIKAAVHVVTRMAEEAREIAENEDLPIDLVLVALVQAWAGVVAGAAK